MIEALILLAVAAAVPADASLTEARHALSAGRFEQARIMIAAAVRSGAKGDAVERLLADFAFASGNNAEALARYKMLLERQSDDSGLLEKAAIAALRLGDIADATALGDRAIASSSATWRAWNARGVAADLEGAGEAADVFYSRAMGLAPGEAEVLNNLGWSRLLRGDWAGAIEPLEQAAAQRPDVARVANNLELARSALASGLPERRPNEASDAWAARLNDAGVVAQLQGHRSRAVAAFSQALVARDSWYKRAADNLRSVEAGN